MGIDEFIAALKPDEVIDLREEGVDTSNPYAVLDWWRKHHGITTVKTADLPDSVKNAVVEADAGDLHPRPPKNGS